MSVTLSTARTEVAARAQEFISGTATGGSTSTIVDTTNLTHADGYFDETTILLTSGTNNDERRRVQTFTAATSTLSLYSSLAGAVVSGVGYELYRRFPPVDVDRAINRAINIAAPDFREKVRAVVTGVQDTLQYAFPTGPDLYDRGLVAVEYQVYDLATQSTFPYRRLAASEYEVLEDWDGTANANLRTLQLNFNPSTNRLIRFIYDGPLGNVATGTARIHLDLPELEWLYTQAVAELWRIETSRTVDANRRSAIEEAARWEANADKLRRQLRQTTQPLQVRRTKFGVRLG